MAKGIDQEVSKLFNRQRKSGELLLPIEAFQAHVLSPQIHEGDEGVITNENGKERGRWKYRGVRGSSMVFESLYEEGATFATKEVAQANTSYEDDPEDEPTPPARLRRSAPPIVVDPKRLPFEDSEPEPGPDDAPTPSVADDDGTPLADPGKSEKTDKPSSRSK
jgi:hypothetical protein